jgi:hypothetical protein
MPRARETLGLDYLASAGEDTQFCKLSSRVTSKKISFEIVYQGNTFTAAKKFQTQTG